MSKIVKSPQPKIKARREFLPISTPKISVSLRYLTTNKNFNFDFFGKNFREKASAFEKCAEFLRQLTAKTMLEISTLSKLDVCGFETIPFAQIKFNPDAVVLGKDTKIHVFCFDTGNNYRMLGFLEREQAVLNIIGFDFNFSTYSH